MMTSLLVILFSLVTTHEVVSIRQPSSSHDNNYIRPKIEKDNLNFTVVEGKTAILPCSVRNLGGHKVKVAWSDQWQTTLTFNENRVIDDDRISVTRQHDREWNLRIDRVKYGDQGTYTCMINTTPSTSQTVSLSVVVPPRFNTGTRIEDRLEVREDDRATLTCNASGIPEPTVTWERAASLQGDHAHRIGQRGEVLVIHNVTRHCGGEYACVVDNGVPPSIRRIINVKVKFAPEVHQANPRISQSLGKETILECVIAAYPHAEVYWNFGGKQLSTSKKYTLDAYKHPDESGRLTLSLHVKNITEADFGFYTCTASNDLGVASGKTLLKELKLRTKKPTTTTSTTTTTSIKGTTVLTRYWNPQDKQSDKQNYSHMPRGRGSNPEGRQRIIEDQPPDSNFPQQRSGASMQGDSQDSAGKETTSNMSTFILTLCLSSLVKYSYLF